LRSPRRHRPGAQRGVVMIMTLIALVLLLIGAAALLRTVDSSSILVGNLAFRRDLTNRAEAAIVTAKATLVDTLNTEAKRQSNDTDHHYYATKLANASNGVPSVLMKSKTYDAAYSPSATDGVTLRWVIDRQCATGTVAYSDSACEYVKATSADPSGSKGATGGPPVKGANRPVYRISVRVTGPRDTEANFQTTYAD
jgi:Tfp pilus assembly protein PilX